MDTFRHYGQLFNMTIIQVYALTTVARKHEVDKFHGQIQYEVYKTCN